MEKWNVFSALETPLAAVAYTFTVPVTLASDPVNSSLFPLKLALMSEASFEPAALRSLLLTVKVSSDGSTVTTSLPILAVTSNL